jgi:hypothetical protein
MLLHARLHPALSSKSRLSGRAEYGLADLVMTSRMTRMFGGTAVVMIVLSTEALLLEEGAVQGCVGAFLSEFSPAGKILQSRRDRIAVMM